MVIAPAKTGNDIINKIAVIKTDHGNNEIFFHNLKKNFLLL